MPVELLNVPYWWRGSVQTFYLRAYAIGQGLNVRVTSWQRSRSHNREVSGAEASQHLIATAWDVAGPDQNVYMQRAQAAGLVAINEGDHVHVQLYRAGVVPDSVYDAVSVA
jgi:hypothetical protein